MSALDDVIVVDQNTFGSFLEVRLTNGDDTVTFENSVNARISYRTALGGVSIDMDPDSSLATDLTIATDFGNAVGTFIGTDAISGATQARGSRFDDQLFGSDRTDIQERFRGSEGVDFIDGRGGTDRLDFFDSPAGIVVDLSLATGQVIDDGFGNTETALNIENVAGNVFNDTITGKRSRQHIFWVRRQ